MSRKYGLAKGTKNISKKVQSKYDDLIEELAEGSSNPNIIKVEKRVDKLRVLYPNIKHTYAY